VRFFWVRFVRELGPRGEGVGFVGGLSNDLAAVLEVGDRSIMRGDCGMLRITLESYRGSVYYLFYKRLTLVDVDE
jgi:hypothetical protein